jgi:carboxyl-terminal processing protease
MLWPTVLLLLATVLPAQPPIPPPPPPPPPPGGNLLLPPAGAWGGSVPALDEGELIAQRLTRICDRISNLYVRPVTRADLLVTALHGLLAAAERPVPDDLESRLRQTVAQAEQGEAWLRSSLGFLPTLPFSFEMDLHQEAERELIQFLTATMHDVEGATALKGRDRLVVCCEAMARSLDSHTELVTAEQSRRRSGFEGEGMGVGVEVGIGTEGALVLTSVYPGGPAQQAGLRPGDRLTHLDGRCVRITARSLGRVQDLLAQGPIVPLDPCDARPCGPLALIWEREGRGGTVVLPRTRFSIETVLGTTRTSEGTWDYTLDQRDGLALVRVASFSRGTAAELRRVLEQLIRDECQGMVLDLRWCPGGYLDEALNVARLFLDEGIVATVSGRQGPPQEYRATGEDAYVQLPLVVLINSGTSGGAELVAAALQDHHRAIVVGQRTLGKGSVQTPMHLDISGVGLKLTTGTFHRPSGRELHRFPDSKPADDWGVRPDVDARVSPDLAALLKRHWLWQTLRPMESRELLPLDEPEADPQEMVATEALRQRIAEKVWLGKVIQTSWAGVGRVVESTGAGLTIRGE